MTLIFAATTTLICGVTAATMWHLRWVQRLPQLDRLPKSPENPGRCSIIIAARNEETRIEQTIRYALAQHGVEVELVVVDDRSTDRTSEILARLAKADSRLRIKRVDTLPEGWLGKCHACHIGAQDAVGEWILFTDADCWLSPDVIMRAVRLADHEGVDHVTLACGQAKPGPKLEAWCLAFLITLANWISNVNRDRPKAHLGFGAFNLVRADTYRRSGGYEALRLTVLDDVKLGLLVRRAGGKTRAFLGGSDVECHWGGSVWSMIKVMEKNYFAALDFRTGLAFAGSTAMTLIGAIMIAGLISGTAAGLAAALSPFTGIIPAAILARRLGWSYRGALLTPIMAPVFLCALLNSTFVTLRNGGVRWRETFYSLEVLRSNAVR